MIARRHLLALRARLAASGRPAGILVFMPSHLLAEEVARGWQESGLKVAVHRGYEAIDPATGAPMCGDLPAVEAAVMAGLNVHGAACESSERRCALFDTCQKQRNRREVAAADVVLATYDALSSGFNMDPRSIGVLMIDEGCWARAWTATSGTWEVAAPGHLMHPARSQRGVAQAASATADLFEFRARAKAAFLANGIGTVRRAEVIRAGLTEQDCMLAAELEERAIARPDLYPGMPPSDRRNAVAQAEGNEQARFRGDVWRELAVLLRGSRETTGRLRVDHLSRGAVMLEVLKLKQVHKSFRGTPILHLDATLRPELAKTVLTGLTVTAIDAAAPHMSVRRIGGSFGKANLCQDPKASPEENRRRANRLSECVDYVRWHAKRVRPGRVLVVTYKNCEAAFADIPGVDVGHFKSIAGLDKYRDVALLIIIGRPLPRDTDLSPMSGAFFDHTSSGGYRTVQRAVLMRDGTSRTVQVREHSDSLVETLRAAICDDEVIQAIGRGRGVNRTEAKPLEVHVLADLALPLVHDRVLTWDLEAPDLVQRMLLDGVAVDSPADAAALHPELFGNAEQAEKAFQRSGFGGHFPIRNLHREMSVKSATYRRPGPGRSRQRVWWIDGDADDAKAILERSLGTLAEWLSEPG